MDACPRIGALDGLKSDELDQILSEKLIWHMIHILTIKGQRFSLAPNFNCIAGQ